MRFCCYDCYDYGCVYCCDYDWESGYATGLREARRAGENVQRVLQGKLDKAIAERDAARAELAAIKEKRLRSEGVLAEWERISTLPA